MQRDSGDWLTSDDAFDMREAAAICQKCGGQLGTSDDMTRCLCSTPTLIQEEPASPSEEQILLWVGEEWDTMYPDVIKDLCLSLNPPTLLVMRG
ncbi:MAG: hypothetical protein H7288_19590 [Kineosporiaceae bacterium]|nr:hypothetical protein [Aeromicrobium sp.]